jgi:hypothetical protein
MHNVMLKMPNVYKCMYLYAVPYIGDIYIPVFCTSVWVFNSGAKGLKLRVKEDSGA